MIGKYTSIPIIIYDLTLFNKANHAFILINNNYHKNASKWAILTTKKCLCNMPNLFLNITIFSRNNKGIWQHNMTQKYAQNGPKVRLFQ